MAKHRERLFELLEDGMLDASTLARDLMGYMSDDECKDFAEKNDIELFPEDDTPDFEFEDDEDVNEAFSEFWEERCNYVPAYRTDKPAKRQAFSMFIDDLERSGRMSEDLAYSVTLSNDD